MIGHTNAYLAGGRRSSGARSGRWSQSRPREHCVRDRGACARRQSADATSGRVRIKAITPDRGLRTLRKSAPGRRRAGTPSAAQLHGNERRRLAGVATPHAKAATIREVLGPDAFQGVFVVIPSHLAGAANDSSSIRHSLITRVSCPCPATRAVGYFCARGADGSWWAKHRGSSSRPPTGRLVLRWALVGWSDRAIRERPRLHGHRWDRPWCRFLGSDR